MGSTGWGHPSDELDPWRVRVVPLHLSGTATAVLVAPRPGTLPPRGLSPQAVPLSSEPRRRTAQLPVIRPVLVRRTPRRAERALLAAVAFAACLLAGGVYALVAVGHGASVRHGAHSGPSATTAPTGTLTLPPASSTTTTAPPTAPLSGQVSSSLAAGGSSRAVVGGGGGGGSLVWAPVNIIDPSPVATATVSSLPLYSAPGAPAPVAHLANPNWLGARVVLLVTGYQGDWVEAYVPQRPNEVTAWIPRADVSISSDPYHINVAIGAHQLVLYKNNVAIFKAPVATGAPDSPTPTGSYFISFIVKLTDPQDAYGPYAMGTSDFSNTYYSFEGGPGQVGIHGTNQPWVIGSYASHGCIRMYNNDISTVAQLVPPGTPVEISA